MRAPSLGMGEEDELSELPALILIMAAQGGGHGRVQARFHGIQPQRICAASLSGSNQRCEEEQASMMPAVAAHTILLGRKFWLAQARMIRDAAARHKDLAVQLLAQMVGVAGPVRSAVLPVRITPMTCQLRSKADKAQRNVFGKISLFPRAQSCNIDRSQLYT